MTKLKGSAAVVPKGVNPQGLVIIGEPGQTRGQMLAQVAVTPAFNAALVVETFQKNLMGPDVEMMALVDSLKTTNAAVKAGDLSALEAMLVGQAIALQSMFTSLARRAQSQEYQKNLEAFLGLALKAQAQSRATISALVDLKYPRQATFVKQANIAHGAQQVNNGVQAETAPAEHADRSAQARAGTGNSGVVKNELLEAVHG